MRSIVTACAVVLSIVSATLMPVTVNAGNRERVVEARYDTPVLGVVIGSGTGAYYWDCLEKRGCAILEIRPRERFAQIEIADITGAPVHANVYTMPGGNHVGEFCGTTEDPVPTMGARELLVHVANGMCPDMLTPSVVTMGIVRATLTRKMP